ncbi:hypothetical protein MYAM1_002172 [Malassezia yamatoensis]|uniref:Conserved oligomeric Golgi complex subunit 2 n=1 Tax=Malassezia yamatoensis TaxID=253288 RepID=A0AAJ5YUC6_9BASI|nr:hypothetical protein MYAM1_002172 [Malassezia yamatoensis]
MEEVDDVPALMLAPPLAHGNEFLDPSLRTSFDVDAFLCSRAYGQDVQSILKELRAYSQTLHEQLIEVIQEKYHDFLVLASSVHQHAKEIKSISKDHDMALIAKILHTRRDELDELARNMQAEKQDSIQTREEQIDAALEKMPSDLEEQTLSSSYTEALHDALSSFSLAELAEDHQLQTSRIPALNTVSVLQQEDRLESALDHYVWAESQIDRVDNERYQPFLSQLKDKLTQTRMRLASHADGLLDQAINDPIHLQNLGLALRIFQAVNCAQYDPMRKMEHRLVKRVLEDHMQQSLKHGPLTSQLYRDDDERATLHKLTRVVFADHVDDQEPYILLGALNGILHTASYLAEVCKVTESIGGSSLDLYNNVLWRLASNILMTQYNNQLFFVGRPRSFHRNYILVQRFLDKFREHAPSPRAYQAFVSHEATRSLEQRWQLSAFFHLCARETVMDLETGLEAQRPGAGFQHGAFNAMLHAFLLPWRATRHIPVLAAREWRLSLHILSRYRSWLEAQAANLQVDQTPASAISTAELLNCAGLLSDAYSFEARVQSCFAKWLLPKIVPADESIEETQILRATLQEAIDSSLGHAVNLQPMVGKFVVSNLQRQCTEPLRRVRAGRLQFRAPVTTDMDQISVSDYVQEVFLPLENFLQATSDQQLYSDFPPQLSQEWASEVICATLERFIAIIDTITDNLESLRRLKRGAPSLQSGSGASSENDIAVYTQFEKDSIALRETINQLARQHSFNFDSQDWDALSDSIERGLQGCRADE